MNRMNGSMVGPLALEAAAQKQDAMNDAMMMRKHEERQRYLQGYQGYLTTCNTFIVLIEDILNNDSPDEDRKKALLKRQEQAKHDACYARENIFRILDDILDRRPNPYAPSLTVLS